MIGSLWIPDNHSKRNICPGPHAEQSARFQVVLASAGQHAKEFLIEDGYLDEVGQAKRETALRRQHIGKDEHWFHPRYFQFADKEDRLPFDAHFAKAVIAPRAMVNCHARQDYRANPYGTELTHRAAEVVFEWLDAGDRIGLHWRDGTHAQNQEDWVALLDFADHLFFDKKTGRRFDNWGYPAADLPLDWKAPGIPGTEYQIVSDSFRSRQRLKIWCAKRENEDNLFHKG